MSQRQDSPKRPPAGSHDLFSKCRGFTRAKELQGLGIYPFFIPIGKNLGTEVEVEGRL